MTTPTWIPELPPELKAQYERNMKRLRLMIMAKRVLGGLMIAMASAWLLWWVENDHGFTLLVRFMGTWIGLHVLVTTLTTILRGWILGQ